MSTCVRRAGEADAAEWLRMRDALWPGIEPHVHREEMVPYIRGDVAVAFVAERDAGGLCGFIEAELRERAEGCESRPVPYIEGWYVDPDARRTGVGRQLVEAVERWAIDRGFTEIGSDCNLDNDVSFRAHTRLGYEEVERLIVFRKALPRHP